MKQGLFILICCLAITSCGQSGKLYLPTHTSQTATDTTENLTR